MHKHADKLTRREITAGFAGAAALLLGGCESQTGTQVTRQERRDDFFREAMSAAVPPGNVRITVNRYAMREQSRESLDVILRYVDEHAKFAASGPGPANGLLVRPMREGFSVDVLADQRSRSIQQRSQQFLLLTPGSAASLMVTQTRTLPWTVVVPVRRGAIVVPAQRLEVTGTGMEVAVARLDAATVEVELRPFFAARDRGEVRVEELVTRVLVPDGQPVVIMSRADEKSTLARTWLGGSSMDEYEQVMLTLRADVGR